MEDLTKQIWKAFPIAKNLVISIATIIIEGVIFFFILLYGLLNPKPLQTTLVQIIPVEWRHRARSIGRLMATQIRLWIQGVLIGMVSIALLSLLGLSLLGVKYAVVFSLLSGLLEIVPYIGPILSAVLPTLVAFNQEPIKAVYVILLYIIIQQIENHALIPLIMSQRLNLHPVGILFFFLVMTSFLGIFGTFIAVPTFVCTSIFLQEIYLKRESLPPL